MARILGHIDYGKPRPKIRFRPRKDLSLDEQVALLVRERDRMLGELNALNGRLRGLDRAIEIMEQESP